MLIECLLILLIATNVVIFWCLKTGLDKLNEVAKNFEKYRQPIEQMFDDWYQLRAFLLRIFNQYHSVHSTMSLFKKIINSTNGLVNGSANLSLLSNNSSSSRPSISSTDLLQMQLLQAMKPSRLTNQIHQTPLASSVRSRSPAIKTTSMSPPQPSPASAEPTPVSVSTSTSDASSSTGTSSSPFIGQAESGNDASNAINFLGEMCSGLLTPENISTYGPQLVNAAVKMLRE